MTNFYVEFRLSCIQSEGNDPGIHGSMQSGAGLHMNVRFLQQSIRDYG